MTNNHYQYELRNELLKRFGESEYFSICINYANNLSKKELPIIFDFLHISKIFNIDVKILQSIIHYQDIFYNCVKIKKKSGGFREINIPSFELKKIQRWILDNILYRIEPSIHANGFIKRKSILNNAAFHLNKNYVLNMDIKDFFPTINQNQVFKVFYDLGYTKEVSFILSKICTFNNKLPQGAPTSPYISNIICRFLDNRLSKLSESFNATYTRYADDLSFSSNVKINNLLPIISKIINEEGFKVNISKTRILEKNQSQNVTGLIVNGEIVRVNKKYKKILLSEIYYCKKFGVNNHLDRLGSKKKFYKEHLYGKAYFIKMVEREIGINFLNLLDEINWDY